MPPSSQAQSAGEGTGQEKLVQDVIHAAYSAFYTGLRAALFLSAALVLAAGLFALWVARKRRPGIALR